MKSGFHESYARREHIKGGSNRGFGLTVGGILVAIGLYRWSFGGRGPDSLTPLLLLIGATLVILGLTVPAALAPLNRAWTKLGLLMGKAVTPVVTFVIYIVAIVPTGLAMRLAGRDPLRLKRDPAARSYWIERRPPGPAPETMRDPF